MRSITECVAGSMTPSARRYDVRCWRTGEYHSFRPKEREICYFAVGIELQHLRVFNTYGQIDALLNIFTAVSMHQYIDEHDFSNICSNKFKKKFKLANPRVQFLKREHESDVKNFI